MSHPVINVTTTTAATDAAIVLRVRGFTALPVPEDGRPVGILTEADRSSD